MECSGSNLHFHGVMAQFVAILRRSGPAKAYAGGEPPLRSEPFSSDQMKRYGKTLADSHAESGTRFGPASGAVGGK